MKATISLLLIIVVLGAGAISVWFFMKNGEGMEVKVFFANERIDPGLPDCAKVYPVSRSVPKTDTPQRASLELLLRGPTESEARDGYLTGIPAGVDIQQLAIEDGVARADFTRTLEAGVAGSCTVVMIRAQIEETLRQFPSVREVVISIDGRVDDILQP